MKNLRWGIIGCGDVTERKSGPAYQQVEGFELYAVMRRDLRKAKDYAKRHNVPYYYDNADEVINHPEIDAVYIATPPDTHALYALKVAAAGKPCCIEKPMAPSYSESKKIEEAFKERNLPLFVSYYRRSLPRFLKVKQWIDSNEIGVVRHVNYIYTRTPSPIDISGEYYWRTNKDVAYGGYFDDLASHTLDLFVYFLGNVVEANGISNNQQGLYTSMDAVVGNWIHKNGVTGSGTWNFGANTRQDIVEVIGSHGVIRFSIFNDENIFLEKQGKVTSLFIKNPDPVQLHHVNNIKEELLHGVLHPSSGATGVHTSWVMEQILK